MQIFLLGTIRDHRGSMSLAQDISLLKGLNLVHETAQSLWAKELGVFRWPKLTSITLISLRNNFLS